MEPLTIAAREVRRGDVAFGMIVTDIVEKGGRPKFFGVRMVASATNQDQRQAVTHDPDELVAVERPRFKYVPRSQL
jgi:hypothetical protein